MCVVTENLKTTALGQACPTVQWHQEDMVLGLAMLTYVHGAGPKDDVLRKLFGEIRYMCVVNGNLKTAALGQACPTVQWHQEGMVVCTGLAPVHLKT